MKAYYFQVHHSEKIVEIHPCRKFVYVVKILRYILQQFPFWKKGERWERGQGGGRSVETVAEAWRSSHTWCWSDTKFMLMQAAIWQIFLEHINSLNWLEKQRSKFNFLSTNARSLLKGSFKDKAIFYATLFPRSSIQVKGMSTRLKKNFIDFPSRLWHNKIQIVLLFEFCATTFQVFLKDKVFLSSKYPITVLLHNVLLSIV